MLSVPPPLHEITGDDGTVSAARLGPHGTYLAYLNATPLQGDEQLNGWPEIRLEHLLDDDVRSDSEVSSASMIPFRGGTGSCVIDTYVTRIGAHHYQEIACLVQGRTSASVIVAATPAATWAQASPPLLRAVAAYQVR